MGPEPCSRRGALLPLGLLVLLVSSLDLFFCHDALALDVPPLTGRVIDLAHILPSDLAASLSSELAQHEQRTGNQVVLLTIPSLQGESLEEFSHRVATTWKLGQKGRDNGVLLLVLTGERRIRIEVGYGLEGKLTDAQASRIIRREMVPRFRAGDYPTGVAAGLRAVMGMIEGTYSTEALPSDEEDWPGRLFLGAASGAVIGGLFGIHWLLRGAGLGGLISFLLGLSGGLLVAGAAAVLGFIGAVFISALLRMMGQDLRGRRRGGWSDSGWTIGSGSGGVGGGSESFSGGGGDFGGGGASGRW
jgi:uncharacterized protein